MRIVAWCGRRDVPRLSTLRLSVLEDLAAQLRYAPKRRIIEQLRRAVSLAPELEPDRLYPEDWMIQRITGYRPDLEEPAGIVGEALRRDLSAFTERVSEHAALTADALGMETLSLDEVQARWSVSARTIERYRRAGLIALRVRDDGRARLIFPLQSVVAYERSHAQAIASAGALTRLSDTERSHIVRLATRACQRFGWSLNEAARRIADREGRSQEGVRQLLLKAGGGTSALSRDDRRRRAALRAWRAGASVARLAERYEKSQPTIRRILRSERAAILREGLLALGLAPDRLVAPDDHGSLDSELLRTGLVRPAAMNAGAFVELARSTPPPDRGDERTMALGLRTLAARLAAVVREDDAALREAALDRAETDARWATRVNARLVFAQAPFILKAIEARLERPLLELPAGPLQSIHRRAMDAATLAVWRFDAARGGRLAAATGLAVDRAVSQWLSDHAHNLPTGTGRARAAGATLLDWSVRIAPWQRWLDPPTRLSARLSRLNEEQRFVATLRFGLSDESPRTREEIAARLGLSARRVAIIERAAMREVRREPPR